MYHLWVKSKHCARNEESGNGGKNNFKPLYIPAIYKQGCEQKAAFSYSNKILTFIHLETYVTIRVLIYMFSASEITFLRWFWGACLADIAVYDFQSN